MAMPKTTTEKRIRRWDLWKVFWRSFFIQSMWNYRSLLSTGFGLCMLPVLRRLYNDEQERRQFLMRHLKFFNAHPYMVSYALGVSIRLEEEYAAGQAEAAQRLDRIKDLLISILGSIGDQLFWLTLRPVALLVGTLGIFLLPDIPLRLGVLATVFLLFNIPHFYMRYKGILEGYQFSTEVYKCFQTQRFQRLRRFYQSIGLMALAGFFLALISHFGKTAPLQLVVILGSMGLNLVLFRIVKNFYFTILLNVLFFFILGISIYEL